MNGLKKWLWIVLIIFLLLNVPAIYSRFTTEWDNNTYEMIVPNDEIKELVDNDPTLKEDHVYDELRKAGLESVSVEPETLKSLEENGQLSIISKEAMAEKMLFDHIDVNGNREFKKNGIFVYIDPDSTYLSSIQKVFEDIKEVKVDDRTFYFIPGDSKKLDDIPLGFNEDVIQKLKSHDFKVVPRISNEIDENNKFVIDQVTSMKDDKSKSFLFLGDEVLGFPNGKAIANWSTKFKENGYSVLGIEFADQKGFASVAHTFDYNVIRLHSINLDDQSNVASVDRVVRAVKERNIRAIYMHLKTGEPKDVLKDTTSFLTDVHEKMPGKFHAGIAEPFKHINTPFWSKAVALLAGVLFATLAAFVVFNKRWAFVIGGIGLIGAIVALFTNSHLLAQVFALVIAVITPVFAIVPKKEIRSFKDIILSYLRAAIISLIGIFIVVSILNGNEYLVKIQMFRGVKLLYILPILFMVVYALWGNIKKLLVTNIRYWHVAVLIVLAGVAYYYLSRTGNEGSVSSIELKIRQLIEETLYVRPRTKEFLIGFPIYLLGLHIMRLNKKVGLFFLIPGVIGFLSLVNTFTHLHIPLYVSLLRSAYSLVLGFIVGVIFIVVFSFIYKYIRTVFKLRWK